MLHGTHGGHGDPVDADPVLDEDSDELIDLRLVGGGPFRRSEGQAAAVAANILAVVCTDEDDGEVHLVALEDLRNGTCPVVELRARQARFLLEPSSDGELGPAASDAGGAGPQAACQRIADDEDVVGLARRAPGRGGGDLLLGKASAAEGRGTAKDEDKQRQRFDDRSHGASLGRSPPRLKRRRPVPSSD